jgi:HSP20 family protein
MKRSFFERLSGSSANEDPFDSFDDEMPLATAPARNETAARSTLEDEVAKGAGQLPVDVHQTPSDIIVRAFVAGVRPDELNISISRDRVEISGTRSEREEVSGPDYFAQELFWGAFSRVIMLPQEIDVEATSANAKDGLLTIILPKLDKAKQTKLRVKAG